jgi:PadR family transcriptional regulator, regulatory protein PadR
VKVDKSLMSGSTTLLILGMLDGKDMYGYQMIEELELRSENIFTLKAGTLYPILHTLEQQGMVLSYDETAENSRPRKYYRITKNGKKLLFDKKEEWKTYTSAVNHVLGGINYV